MAGRKSQDSLVAGCRSLVVSGMRLACRGRKLGGGRNPLPQAAGLTNPVMVMTGLTNLNKDCKFRLLGLYSLLLSAFLKGSINEV